MMCVVLYSIVQQPSTYQHAPQCAAAACPFSCLVSMPSCSDECAAEWDTPSLLGRRCQSNGSPIGMSDSCVAAPICERQGGTPQGQTHDPHSLTSNESQLAPTLRLGPCTSPAEPMMWGSQRACITCTQKQQPSKPSRARCPGLGSTAAEPQEPGTELLPEVAHEGAPQSRRPQPRRQWS